MNETDSAIVPQEPSDRRELSTDVRADLAAARERVRLTLEGIEERLSRLGDWRAPIRRHPYLAIGGALVVGFGLARLFTRR